MGWGVVAVLVAVGVGMASAQSSGLSDNVRTAGIDSRQRDQAGSRIRRSRAVGLVRAPADHVTGVILDYAGYRQFMPHFVASRVLSKRGSQAVVYIEVSALEGLTRLWAQMQIRMEPATPPTGESTRVISARMIKGNLRGFEAEWQVTPISSAQTLVAFELCADPDFPIPFANGLVSDYNELEARKSVLALRGYMAQRGLISAR